MLCETDKIFPARMKHARYVVLDALNKNAPDAGGSVGNALDWHPPHNYPALMMKQQSLSMREFNTWLRKVGVADLESVGIPGGYALLPWGVRIAERFATLVRDTAKEIEFDEVSYPQIVPIDVFWPSADLIDLGTNLLRVVENDGTARYALTPTGEQQIYTYWARTLRRPEDYPARIFQRSRYYRPTTSHQRSGGGAFKGMEAIDVFEFHGSFLSAAAAESCACTLQRSLARLLGRIGVPTVWTARPPWTNKGHLYEWLIGGDALLPNNTTVQVAGSYFQDKVFSRRYNIGVGPSGSRSHASQIDGFVSRRALLAALFRAAAGASCIHPELAPDEAVILVCGASANECCALEDMTKRVSRASRRFRLEVTENKAMLRRAQAVWIKRRVPAVVLVFGTEDNKFDRIRCVIIRGDDGREAEVFGLGNLETTLSDAIDEIGRSVIAISNHDTISSLHSTRELLDVSTCVTRGSLAVAPLVGDNETVSTLERTQGCEVLGLMSAPTTEPCIVSGRASRLRAIVGRRL